MKELLEQYKAAKAVADGLESQLYMAFMQLKTVEEKFKMVNEFGTDFLKEEGYYCPHVKLKNRKEVSLYDDLWVQRHQTLTLSDLIEDMLSDLDVEWDENDEVAMFESVYVEAINQDTALAAIVRDMLDSGIRAGTFDW
ncbi:hypothetical protein D3C75_672000 [compost metagenome]